MRRATVTSIAAILAATLTANVSADNHKSNHGQAMKMERFKEADLNKDGLVAHGEVMKRVKEKFDSLDTNGDGFLELTELPKEMPMPQPMLKHIEGRKAKMKTRMAERGKEDGEMSKRMRSGMEGKSKEHGNLSRLKFVAKLDRDGDEKVSLDEFSVRALKRFKRHDLDGDGNISVAEMEKTSKHKMMKKRHKDKKHRDG